MIRPHARWIATVALALLAVPLSAQAKASAAVQGTVYDSVGLRPLAGARLQLIATPTPDSSYVAIADSLGRFSVSGMRPGRYVIGFFHDVLDSLGVKMPLRAVDLDAGSTTTIALAIPSAPSIVASLCGARAMPGQVDSTGTVIGYVRDADSGDPLASSTVIVMWNEVVLGAQGVRSERRQVPVKTDSRGWYALCRVPIDAGLSAHAEHGARASGSIDLAVPMGGLAVQDFSIGGSDAAGSPASTATTATTAPVAALPRGTARLSGTVRDKTGKALAGAQIDLVGTDAHAVSNEAGSFSLSGLPSGTQTLEARYVGYQPARVAVSLSSGAPRDVNVVMSERVTELAATTVVGKTVEYGRGDPTGFLTRKANGGGGTYSTRAEIEKFETPSFCKLMQRMGLNVSYGSPRGGGLISKGCRVLMHGDKGGCEPLIYQDGTVLNGNVIDLESTVVVSDIAAIEIYRGPASTPAQFLHLGGKCGAIVVWTGNSLK
ncbi:MAG: carboxypeptidase regulatory-like domain-containing protein [Gemmatimonadota bacterium]|nr:carboxypeptidase regulatory-like domain-containing protein [Gemmatimonadota bacterium]